MVILLPYSEKVLSSMYEWLSVSMCWGQEGDVDNPLGEQGDARFSYSYTYVNLLKETELNT